MLVESDAVRLCTIFIATASSNRGDVTRTSASRSQRVDDLIAADVGQGEVEQHQIGIDVACEAQCLTSALRR